MLIGERTTYPESGDLNTCCGKKTAIQRSRVEVKTMSQPPSTYDRWLEIVYWQCMVVYEHRGQVWETTDEEEELVHRNIFDYKDVFDS